MIDMILEAVAGMTLILFCGALCVVIVLGIMRLFYWNFGAKWPWDK